MSWHRPHFFSRKSKRKSETASPDSVSLPGLPSTETSPEVVPSQDVTTPYTAVVTDEDLKKHGFVGKQLKEIKARASKKAKAMVVSFKETPKIERIKTNMTKEEFVDTVKDTKIGMLIGVPAVIVMWPVMAPLYLVNRVMGQDRETATTNSFQLAFKIVSLLALATFGIVTAPTIVGPLVALGLLPIIMHLWKPVDQWTEMDVSEFKNFMGRVQDDPEVQKKMVEIGTQVATKVGQAALASSEAGVAITEQEAVIEDLAPKAADAEYDLYLNEMTAASASDAEYNLYLNKESTDLGNSPILSPKEIVDAQSKIDSAARPLLTPEQLSAAQAKIKEYKDAQTTLATLVKKKENIKTVSNDDITRISLDAAKTTAGVTVRQAEKEGKIQARDSRAMQSQIDLLAQRGAGNRELTEDETQKTVQTFARASPADQSTRYAAPAQINRKNPGFTSTPITLAQKVDVLMYSQQTSADEQTADQEIAAGGPSASQAKGTKIAMLNIRTFLKGKPNYNYFLNWLEKKHDETDQDYKDFAQSNADVMDPTDFQVQVERLKGEASAYEDYALKIRARAR